MGNKCLSKDNSHADASHLDGKNKKKKRGGSIRSSQVMMSQMKDVADANGVAMPSTGSSVDTGVLNS